MSKYVLEILDGSQKGSVLELGQDRVTIGRKADSGLVLSDEKCSGHHAEVVFEDGRYVLRDLDSRNGTILDGGKIQEVVLSAFDVMQVGRTQIVFREEGQTMAVDDLSVATLDVSTVARRGGSRKLPLGTIAVILLLLGGGGAWAWLQFGGGEAGGGKKGPAKPLRVASNMIKVGIDNFEADGGWVLNGLESAGFEISGVANTGDTSIEAIHRVDEESGEKYRLALAHLSDPLTVTPESKLRIAAHLETEGAARAAVRLTFISSEDGATLIAGTTPAAYEGFTETSFEVAVPRGMDRAEVQILALLPDAESIVRADDVSVVIDRESTTMPVLLSTNNGRVLAGAGASFRVTSGVQVVIEGVRPVVTDPLLQELDTKGELAPCDAGVKMTVAASDAGFDFRIGDLGAATGIVIDLPSGSSSIVARNGADASFGPRDIDFSARTTDVVFGSDATRCSLEFTEPVLVTGKSSRRGYALEIDDAREFAINVRFEEAARTAREQNRTADRAHREGRLADALDAIQQVIEKYPYDDRITRQAQSLRVGILGELGQRVAALRYEGAAARFFDARPAYERVAAGVDDLIAEYGERHVPQLDALRGLVERMRDGIAVLDRDAGQEHKQELQDLANALDDAGQGALTAAVRDYVKRAYPQSEGGN